MRSILKVLKLFGTAFAAIALLLCGLAAYTAFQDWRNESFANRFAYLQPELDRFYELAISPTLPNAKTHAEVDLRAVFRSPKVVAVTMRTNRNSSFLRRSEREIDPLMTSLDAAWIPESVEAVNLVVATEWGEEHVGKFTDGSDAYQEVCGFSVFEKSTRQLILQGRAVGTMPPSRKSDSAVKDIFGKSADSQVVQLLREEFQKLSLEN